MPLWPFEKPGFTINENLKRDTAKANPDGSINEIRATLTKEEGGSGGVDGMDMKGFGKWARSNMLKLQTEVLEGVL